MSDELAAYHSEILAIEDAWFEELARREHPWMWLASSCWPKDWERLREVQERHGIRPGDLRVFSIASFKHEEKSIEDELENHRRDCERLIEADPEASPPDARVEYRLLNRMSNCTARHFPGLNIRDPEATADSIPKVWRFISVVLEAVENPILWTGNGRFLDEVSGKKAKQVCSLLLRCRIPWAPDPMDNPRDFTGRDYRDQIRYFANRLEQEEAESLPPESRRMFANGSQACARLEWIDPGRVQSSLSSSQGRFRTSYFEASSTVTVLSPRWWTC